MSAFEAFGLVVVALFFKLFATTAVQGVVRLRHRAFVRPEDAAFFGRGVTPLEREHVLVQRAQNVLRNDGENVPIFLALLLAFSHVDGRAPHVLAYGLAFVATRVVHTLAYLRPTQPLRNRAYVAGLVVDLALVVQLVIAAVS